jgi:hypothetical protein
MVAISYFKEAIKHEESIEFLTRKHLQKYVDYIAVYPAEKGGGERVQRIEIHYQFIGFVDMRNQKAPISNNKKVLVRH